MPERITRLDGSEAFAALQSAARCGCSASVTLIRGGAGKVMRGRIVGLDDASVCLVMQEPMRPAAGLIPGALVEISFIADHCCYRFRGTVGTSNGPGIPKQIQMSRPDQIDLVERRRSPRRRFSRTAVVKVWRPANGSAPIQAVMLNLSEDGLACRIHPDEHAPVAASEQVRIRFPTGLLGEELELSAQICSVVPGGTDGSVIVGMVFEDDPKSDGVKARLATALTQASEVPS